MASERLELQQPIQKKEQKCRDVSVLLKVGEDGNLDIKLSYVVMNSSWSPSYDIRCVTQTENPTTQLVYYGNILNNTGEDWKDVEISLSTAQPAIGGSPGTLNTVKVQLYHPSPVYSHPAYDNPMYMSNIMHTNVMASDMDESKTAERKERKKKETIEPPKAVSVLTTQVQESATSTTFKIPRNATIVSDNKPHKVTISIIDLAATFTHNAIPKLAQHAYLRAICINTSEYPFLEGKMNVFMDNSFVTTSNLKKTNPRDELSLFLGVDPGVVVEFKEEQFSEGKFLTKSATLNYKHTMSFKNTKPKEIDISIFDQLPLSQEEKTKVKLVKPTLVKDDLSVILNDFNNLRWTTKIPAGEKKIIEY